MKLFNSVKFWALSVIAIVACTACEEDEVEPIGHGDHDPVNLFYQGECVYSASMGKIQWCDTIPGFVSLVTVDGEIVSFGTSPIDSLVITPANMVIDKMPSFYIDSLEAYIADCSEYGADSYITKNVPCTLHGKEDFYDATGKVEFKLHQDSIYATYSFKLGKMPLSIQVDFKGTALK